MLVFPHATQQFFDGDLIKHGVETRQGMDVIIIGPSNVH